MKKLFFFLFIAGLISGMVFPRKILSKSPKTITVQSPKGGENWILGSYENIVWKGMGFSGQVTISMWRKNAFVGNIAQNRPRQGSLRWKVGSYMGGNADPGGGYKVKVMEQGKVIHAAVKGISRGSFTIRKPLAISQNTNLTKLPKAKFRIKLKGSGLCRYSGYSDGIKFKVTFEPTYKPEYAKAQLKNKEVSLFIKGKLMAKVKAVYPHTIYTVSPDKLKKLNLLPGNHNVFAQVIVDRSLIVKGSGKFEVRKGILKIEELTVNLGSVYYFYTAPGKNVSNGRCLYAGVPITVFARFSDRDSGDPLDGEEVEFRVNAGKSACKVRTNGQGIAKFVIPTTAVFKKNDDYNSFFFMYVGEVRIKSSKHQPGNWYSKAVQQGWNFYFKGNKLYSKASDINKVKRFLSLCPPGTNYEKGTQKCHETVYTQK
ncbi:MAG: hypothetical protein ABFR36_07595 [Acidobacteriota bacterium]